MTTKEKAMKQKSTTTLYDLSEELKLMMEDIEEWALDNDGDVSGFPLDRLEKLEGDVKAKVLKCAVMYKEWKAQGVAIKSEVENLTKRRKAHENRGEAMKTYMESCLPANAKFEDARSSVAWKKNPPAVEVIAPIELMPEKFLNRPQPEVDKTELKACMVDYEVDLKDQAGNPVLDADGNRVKVVEAQVRWPRPVEDDLPFPDTEDAAVEKSPKEDYFILARLTQGKSLSIK